jgi:hypothetical protein
MGRTAKQKKSKKRNLPPGIEPEAIRKAFKQLRKGDKAGRDNHHHSVVLDYQQMQSICTTFVECMMGHVRECSNPFEKEMIDHATGELFDLLKNKYALPAMDSAVVLLACGIRLLNRCDAEIEKIRHDEWL